MIAAIGEVPPDHKGGYQLASDAISTTADTYEAALEQLQRTVPEGWRILSIRVDR
jgi:hypothetical protein